MIQLKPLVPIVLLTFLLTGANCTRAETVGSLKDTARKAIQTNPEVEARWHAFLAAGEEQASAQGGFRPQIDLSAGIGRERLDPPTGPSVNYTRSGTSLSLTQMLYDGLARRHEVDRLGYARLVRYFELLDAAESTALESVRAYADVLRYRELVEQARENYVQHRLLFDQVRQRTESGVGRRVDLELAGGRLALAESNLLTEASNLHDVSARYQRIVGELPAASLNPLQLPAAALPPDIAAALKLAYGANPAFNAALENIRAAQAELSGRDAPFRPRLDLRARNDLGRNIDGVSGNRSQQVVELLFNMNLYNGGANSASKRQYGERLNLAKDLRDKSCRDIRQTLAIAHNDIGRLTEQLDYLGQHQNAISKARVAYRQQFEIGQRTLLDLLDIQNEYFQARRAQINATNDLSIAQARTLAGMGRLLQTLEISRDGLNLQEAQRDGGTLDPASLCPAEGPDMQRFDKQAILDEALKSGAVLPFRPVQPAAAEAAPATAAAAPEARELDPWYAEQRSGSYVLQLLSVKSPQEFDTYIQQHGLKDCHRFTKQRDEQTLHVLTCGVYADRAAAKKAIARLPGRVRTGNPMPYRIDDILAPPQP